MKKFFLLISLIPIVAFSQANDREKLVNTYTISYQREPAIARNSGNGKYIIVWTSYLQDGDGEGIFAQWLDKNDKRIGKEFQVNTNSKYDQNKPAVALNSRGNCVIVWATTKPDNDLQDIYCVVYDTKGNKIGGEILVNTTTIKSQNCPDIAMDAKGNFVITWHSWDEDGSDRGVYAQKFRYDGVKIGPQFLVNTYTKFSQCEPSIAMSPSGNFVITWQSWGQENQAESDSIDYGIYAQIFNADCTKNGKEIHVNTITKDDQFYPDAAMDDKGNFLIAWTSWNSLSPDYSEIAAQRFDKDGNKIGTEFIVNTTLPEYQWMPAVVLNNDGSFAVAWGSWKQDKSREGVYLQFFNSNGKKHGNEIQVNTYTESYQWEPQIVSDDYNNIITVYSSWNQDGDDYDVYTRKIKK